MSQQETGDIPFDSPLPNDSEMGQSESCAGPTMEETLDDRKLDRRDFLSKAGMTIAAGGLLSALPACGPSGNNVLESAAEAAEVVATEGGPEFEWDMVTSWALALDTIFGGPVRFAQEVNKMTGGRFRITPHSSDVLVPALEILHNVHLDAIPAGHSAGYYYVGLSPATTFSTTLPFGFTYRQQDAWLHEGGGLELMQLFYADRFNVINFPAGNTGVQMGGWFHKQINTVTDLQGLRMRIPGFGGRVLERLGVTVQLLPGSEIFRALQRGTIDAAEWIGPHDDLQLGIHELTQYYYYPGWWEPGPSLEVYIALDRWNQLPEEYQAIVRAASYVANTTMMSRYDNLNPIALSRILQETEVNVQPFPEEVLLACENASLELYAETSDQDSDFDLIYRHWKRFFDLIAPWYGLAEAEMIRWTGRQR